MARTWAGPGLFHSQIVLLEFCVASLRRLNHFSNSKVAIVMSLGARRQSFSQKIIPFSTLFQEFLFFKNCCFSVVLCSYKNLLFFEVRVSWGFLGSPTTFSIQSVVFCKKYSKTLIQKNVFWLQNARNVHRVIGFSSATARIPEAFNVVCYLLCSFQVTANPTWRRQTSPLNVLLYPLLYPKARGSMSCEKG